MISPTARLRLASVVLICLGAAVVSGCSSDDTGPGSTPATTADSNPSSEAESSASAATATALAPDIEGREVRFAAADGAELAGTIFGDGPTGVVLAHMRGRDRGGWLTFASRAAAAGYRVLAFDFRGYGASTGERDTELTTDISAAVELLRSEGTERTIVIGASMGATAAISYAAEADISGVASLSAPANFLGLEAAGVAVNVGEPLLLIAAENDQPYVDDARVMADAAQAPLLSILSGASHGTDLFADHETELTALLLDFIADRSG